MFNVIKILFYTIIFFIAIETISFFLISKKYEINENIKRVIVIALSLFCTYAI